MKNEISLEEFNYKYKTEEDCLDQIFKYRYEGLKICPKCAKETQFFKVSNRKCYACQYCGFQLYPLANTIFHKTDTNLRLWFYAFFLFSNNPYKVNAKELQRKLGVTYKTAWRILEQIKFIFNKI